jgi:hypothetical protein
VDFGVLKRFATIILCDPKAALAAVMFKLAMNLDKKFRKIWKLVDKARGYLSKSEAYVLYFSAKKCSSLGTIVEIGSYEGRSTIALGGAGVTVYAIDPHTGAQSGFETESKINTWDAFLSNTKDFTSIRPVRKLSVDATGDIGDKKIELMFVDGWHSEKAVDEDIITYLPFRAEHFTIVFDDWGDTGVSAGIIKNLKILPPVIGAFGKVLIFSDNDRVVKSLIGKCIKKKTSSSVLKTYTLN